MSGWTALRIRIPASLEDPILLLLDEGGTLGVQIDDGSAPPLPAARPEVGAGEASAARIGGAIENEPTGERTATAWFPAAADLDTLLESLLRLDPSLCLGRDEVADELWVERQEAGREPLCIGMRFLIAPSVDSITAGRAPARGERIVLLVPPKRAFGTGEHETTRLCLELLERVDPAGLVVLDFGTGSGILGLAAAALGAVDVLALDDDPEAIEVARENIALNGSVAPPHRFRLAVGSLPQVEGRFDLILANIFAGVLEAAAPRLASHQATGGRVILSGFSSREASEVAAAWEREGYSESAGRESGDWAALLLEKRP